VKNPTRLSGGLQKANEALHDREFEKTKILDPVSLVRNMASIGRITGALINGTLEPSVALANLHFDFTLIKVDAPREFADVGTQLSAQRRDNAEAGSSHVLARKLGALFRDLVPTTPELVKAYGSRASAIIKKTTAQNQGSTLHGFFAGVVGADATSMWAAATSGKHAIACHLLACLLARMWDAPEATSYWMELITRRKKEIRAENDEANDVTLAVIARESFQRSELAEWDASARAWLRVADTEMALQQTQVRLILDNLSLPINSKADTYESIIEAWKSSLQQMERLLAGHPQEARDGAILLGLHAWHLYPDMIVLGAEQKEVKQKDPLFDGRGILTVGLSREDGSECQGIYWSLPLRYLRYYGLPVPCKRSLHSGEGSRISIDQLLLAWTAAYTSDWDDGSLPVESVLTFFAEVTDQLHWELERMDPNYGKVASTGVCRSWLRLLSEQAQRYLDSTGPQKKVLEKLWKLGKTHCTMFRQSQPLFNLFTPSSFLRAAESLERKVECLREIAKPLKRSHFLIRYQHSYGSTTVYEYTTAVPQTKRLLLDEVKENHTRWIWKLNLPDYTKSDESEECDENISQYFLDSISADIDSWAEYFTVPPANSRVDFTQQPSQMQFQQDAREAREKQLLSIGESIESFDLLREFENSRCAHVKADATIMPGWYVAVLGDEECQLLQRLDERAQDDDGKYEKTNEQKALWASNPKVISAAVRDFSSQVRFATSSKRNFFRPGLVSFQKCAQELVSRLSPSDPALRALRGMAAVAALYEASPSATVDVRSLRLDLTRAKWLVSAAVKEETVRGQAIKVAHHLGPIQLSYAASFACIAMMDTGRFDLEPGQLESVTALSSGDSLYVPSSLLHDPADVLQRFRIQRLTGNIGRAGLILLVPPSNPMMRTYDALNDWQVIDHADFDGRMENNFASTSLQLSFTDATLPLNVGFSGGVDVEAYFLETLVSVYDAGKWVADLDVLKALESPYVSRVVPCPDARTDPCIPKCTSVDRYSEMLCDYTGTGIVRAWGNWQARLAATAICFAKGYHVVIMSEEACWRCVKIKVDKAYIANAGKKAVVIS
jgi:hypothetical protein